MKPYLTKLAPEVAYLTFNAIWPQITWQVKTKVICKVKLYYAICM